MAYLVLVRHGESTWNAQGLWTGWTDVDLTEKGREEAREAGKLLHDINFDRAFTSKLVRAQETLEEIKKIKGCNDLPTEINEAINERNYGDLTGKNKWKLKEEYGDEQFLKWRRGWDCPIPNGESLKQVYSRVVPYYQEHIQPYLKEGKNILVAAHGNSLRALIKYLEEISDEDISKMELKTGEIVVYQVDSQGKLTSKESRVPVPASTSQGEHQEYGQI